MEPARAIGPGHSRLRAALVLAPLALAVGLGADAPPAVAPAPTPSPAPAPAPARNVRVRDFDGREVVARVYSESGNGVVLLPDGRLGWPRQLLEVDEPFVPETADVVAGRLTDGPYRSFRVYKAGPYVVLSEGTAAFAEASAALLESLYTGLARKLAEKGFPVREPEFPLVAIVYHDERAFRAAHAKLPADVQAFFDVVTNRIYFYESSARDREAPDLAARRRPQTVAHEGAHQVLQNIGVQPRLADWPPWVVEGLAEYFAPTTVGKDGTWDGANRVNPFHMATIRDLHDPLAFQRGDGATAVPRIGRDPRAPVVKYLVERTDLTPTDYALSWALTHFLANKHFGRFVAYLRALGERPPLKSYTPEQNLEEFTAILAVPYGGNLAQLDRAFSQYLSRLRDPAPQPYYAVTFEQPVGPGVVRRAVMVSQSTALIQQWVAEMTAPDGGSPSWRARPFPTRTRAKLAAEQWLNGS
jgi:hypothetical protein